MSNEAPLRERFPILASKTYLNSCSYGALSSDVDAALKSYATVRNEKGADWGSWVEKLQVLRTLLGTLMNVPSGDLAITSSLSEAVNALSSALRYGGTRRRIVLTNFDFPTTSQIWRAQEAHGAETVTVNGRDGQLRPEDMIAAIDERTLIVSIPTICYWNGARTDIAPVITHAKKMGALVFLDIFQGIGTYPFDALASGADFVAGGCTKYLIGGSGVGFLYVRDSLDVAFSPTRTGWFAQANPNAMDSSAHHAAPDARRFEAGTPPVASLYCAEAGLKLLQSIPAATIWSQIQSITDQIKREAVQAGLTLATPVEEGAHGAMIAIRAARDAELVETLVGEGVIATSRAGNLRIAPHFYNNASDVDALFAGLARHRHLID